MLGRVRKAEEVYSKDRDISVMLRINQEWRCIDKKDKMIIRRNNVRIEMDMDLFNTLFEVVE